MMMDILSTNRTHIDDALQGMIGALEQLRSKLLAGDEIDLADQLRKVQERRRWLESNHPPGRQP
jgi:hypothetical protein